MAILTTVYIIISCLLIFFLVLPFFNVLLSRFVTEKVNPKSDRETDFGNIITAYRNADIAKGLVQSLLQQKHQNHHIYLVADKCDISSWDIEHEKLTVLRPEEPLNLKAKSIIHAIENFVRPHEYISVFDADNLAHPDFLPTINRYVNAGHRSIQGQRTAKNLDTFYACADATGEFYKNYIERYVPYLIGSSSVISGSGMAVEAELYKAYLASPEIDQGKHLWKKMLQEDKILQNFLLRKNERIVYAWDAVVYDEKVTSGDAVETQRTRWLYSYFQNIPNSLGILRRAITNFSWNQWLFGWITITPPMFIMLFSAMALAVLGFFLQPMVGLALVAAIGIFALTIFWTLYLSKAPKPIWNAIWSLPLFVLKQFTALFKMGNPNKNFKHTEHKVSVSVEDVLEKEL